MAIRFEDINGAQNPGKPPQGSSRPKRKMVGALPSRQSINAGQNQKSDEIPQRSPKAQAAFDRVAYQRELMRKRRAAKKAKVSKAT